MAVEISYHENIRRRMLAGVDQLADAIKVTLGPNGRITFIQDPGGVPVAAGNAAAIAKDFIIEDPVENMGAQVIREAAFKTGEAAGGGSAIAAVLTQHMIREGFRNIAAGANPVELRKGLQYAAQLASAAIKRLARPADTPETIAQIAAVSSGDSAIGALVAKVLGHIGSDGAVTIEEGGGRDVVLHVEEGTQFDRGLLSPYMATDPERLVADLDNPYIFITDKKLTSAQELLHLLEEVMKTGRALLIIADQVEGEALGMLAVNAKSGTLRVAAVAAPAYGEGRRARLEDLAILTGGKLFSEELGYTLREVALEHLGRAASVRVDRHSTVITGGSGRQEVIAERAASLRAMMKKTEYEFDRAQIEERLAKLTGGTASIRVGAATEVEMKEKKMRIEEALRMARSAQAEGIVPGGGRVFLDVMPAMRVYLDTLSGDKRTGASIVLSALEIPTRQIAENAGMDGGAVIAEIKRQSTGIGLDVLSGTYTDMVSSGIVDPAKSTRLALLHAASIAATLLTAEAGITNIQPVGK